MGCAESKHSRIDHYSSGQGMVTHGVRCCCEDDKYSSIMSTGHQQTENKSSNRRFLKSPIFPFEGFILVSPSSNESDTKQSKNPRGIVRRNSSVEKSQNDVDDNVSSPVQQVALWDRPPKPLPNWTDEEQGDVIKISSQHPKASRDPIARQALMQTLSRKFPTKTFEEVKACYKYIQSKKMAFFGNADSINASNPDISSQ